MVLEAAPASIFQLMGAVMPIHENLNLAAALGGHVVHSPLGRESS